MASILPPHPSASLAAERSSGKRRKPFRAVLLNILVMPLGYLYVGRPWRGVIFALLAAAFSIALGILLAPTFDLGRLAFIVAVSFVIEIAMLVDTWRLARRAGADYRPRSWQRWYVYLPVALLFGFAGMYATAPLEEKLRAGMQAFHLPSASMAPNLLMGDYILVDKAVYRESGPARFDVVVFLKPEDEKTFIKRVIGLPGETVEIRDKKVLVNGNAIDDPYGSFTDNPERRFPKRDDFGPETVPAHSYFLMGDNRDHSHDSRFFGFVEKSKLIGKVRLLYWSWDAETMSVRWQRVGMRFPGGGARRHDSGRLQG